MAIKYTVSKKAFGFDPEKEEKFVVRSVSSGKINFEEFSKEVAQLCHVHRGVVHMVITQVTDCMIDAFKEGKSVQLGDLGTFRPTVSAKASQKEEEANQSSITSIRVVYTPGKTIKEAFDGISLKEHTT